LSVERYGRWHRQAAAQHGQHSAAFIAERKGAVQLGAMVAVDAFERQEMTLELLERAARDSQEVKKLAPVRA
jgi:hypothetical protein